MNRVIKVDSSAISFDEKTNEVIILKVKPLFLLLGVDFKAYHDRTHIVLLESRFMMSKCGEIWCLMYDKGMSYDGNNLKLNATRDDIMAALKTDDLSTISFSFIINDMNKLIKILIAKDIELDTSLHNIVHKSIILKRDHMDMFDAYYKPRYEHKFGFIDINTDGVIIDFVVYNKDTKKTYPISRKEIKTDIRYDSMSGSITLSNKELCNILAIDDITTEYYGSIGLVGYFAEHTETDRITLMKLEYICYVDNSTFIVHEIKKEEKEDTSFIDRLHIELKELEEKFNKLSAFLETDIYKKMDSEEHKFLLYNQHIAMTLYVNTLKARLFLLEKK